ncbi:MAG: DMT family transporter [Chloroflexi bacterium]|nr:DMT family transporter [Chloroflexota bacterium]
MPVDLGDLVALAGAIGWAGTSVLARVMSRWIPALWYNALRIVVASVAMLAILPWTLAQADMSGLSLKVLVLLLLSVLVGFGIGDTAFFESMRRIGVARAAPIAGANPLLTAVLAVAFLGEPVTVGLLAGIVVIVGGVWLITLDSARPHATTAATGRRDVLIGVGLALLAALGWSSATALVRPAMEQIDAILASTIRLPFAAVVLVAAASRASMIDSRRLELKRKTVIWLIGGGLLTVVSATLFLWSVELIGAARTSALSAVSPIFSASIAVLALGERLTVRLVLGVVISSIGVLTIVLGR